MNGFELASKNWLGVVLIATCALGSGCNPTTVNMLQGIRQGNGTGILVGTEKLFVLEGRGTCTSVTVDWGDGTIENVVPVSGQKIEFETSAIETRYLKHTYTGWGGGKTVSVEGHGCEGKIRAGSRPTRAGSSSVGWRTPAGTTGVCQTVAALPGMIPRMLVHVSVTISRVATASVSAVPAASTTRMAGSARLPSQLSLCRPDRVFSRLPGWLPGGPGRDLYAIHHHKQRGAGALPE